MSRFGELGGAMSKFRSVLWGTALVGLIASMSVGADVAHGAVITSGASTLRYTASPGEANFLTLAIEGRTLLLNDTGAGPAKGLPTNCQQVPTATTLSVRCDAPGDWVVRLDLADGDDRVEADTLPRRISLRVQAGEGENIVVGGGGDDQIFGGSGRDTLYGVYGNDLVDGGDGDNYVRGNSGDDDIRGGSGIDFVIGDGGNDVLRGGGELDFLYSGGGDDVVFGGGGPDSIDLAGGNDTAYGDAGLDDIEGGSGTDRMYGGGDDDLIRARDGEPDTIDCGAGSADVARVDAAELDQARRSCERIREAETP